MTKSQCKSSRGIRCFALVSVLFYATPGLADTDCLYEFNNAFATNEAGGQQLNQAKEHAAEAQLDVARKLLHDAIQLLSQSIAEYRSLPDRAFDCSPSQLTIANNNIRIAEDNIQLAKNTLKSWDCLGELQQIEALNQLANDYYQQRDTESAKTAAADALAAATQLQRAAHCEGEYADNLVLQLDYAQQFLDSIQAQQNYDQCRQLYAAVMRAEQQVAFAQNADQRNSAWGEVLHTAQHALAADVCATTMQQQLIQLEQTATDALQRLKAE